MKDLKLALILIVLGFLAGTFSGQVYAKDRTIEYMKTVTVENGRIIKDYIDKTEPYIFPVITATTGAIVGGVTAAAAGATTPVIITAIVLNGVTGYFYGYGVESAIDRHLIVPNMMKEKEWINQSFNDISNDIKKQVIFK